MQTHDRSGGRTETEKERIDRELNELLQELRVAIPGVQVLFAFLLTIPFAQGFSKLESFERDVYFASLLFAAAATALLMSPTAYHRIHFRGAEKERLVFTSNRLSIAGLLLLAIAMGLAVFVVASTMFDLTVGALVAAGVAGWFGWFWYGLPLSRRLGNEKRAHPDG